MKKNKIELNTELLILPDGRILVQNLTQPMAELLNGLNSEDETIASRAKIGTKQSSDQKICKQS